MNAPDHLTESETPHPTARSAGHRSAALRWLVAGATVLTLGAGTTLLARQAEPTQASPATVAPALPNGGASPQTQPPQPPQPGQRTGRPGAARLGVIVDPGPSGLTVRQVLPGSAAETGGLKAGDVITAVNGQAVKTVQDVRQQLKGKQPGEAVAVAVNRGGATVNLSVTLPQRPVATAGQPGRGQAGARPGAGPRGGFGGLGIDALQGVPRDQRFDHLLGSQFTVLNASGQRVTFESVPGKVMAASATSLTIQANDPQRGAVTYIINADTKVPGPAGQGQNLLANLKPADHVVVVAQQGQNVAKAVLGAARGHSVHAQFATN